MATKIISDLRTWEEYEKVCDLFYKTYKYDTAPKGWEALVKPENRHNTDVISHKALKEAFLLNCNEIIPGYNVDGHNEPVIDAMIMWLRHDPDFLKISPAYSFEKGLMVRGGVGAGKTVLFKAFQRLISIIKFWDFSSSWPGRVNTYGPCVTKAFVIVPSNIIASDFTIDGFEIFNYSEKRKTTDRKLTTERMLIDDMGSEQLPSFYGNTVNIIGEVITRRYDENILTHLTSNLSIEELKTLYGLRVYDRLRAMVNDIVLKGESRRK